MGVSYPGVERSTDTHLFNTRRKFRSISDPDAITSELVLYLSVQDQIKELTPRQQVSLAFYADRITSTLPLILKKR